MERKSGRNKPTKASPDGGKGTPASLGPRSTSRTPARGVVNKPVSTDPLTDLLTPIRDLLENPVFFPAMWAVAAHQEESGISLLEGLHKIPVGEQLPLPGITVLIKAYSWLLKHGTSEELEMKIKTLSEAECIIAKEMEGCEDEECSRFRKLNVSNILDMDYILRHGNRPLTPLEEEKYDKIKKIAESPPPTLLILNGLREHRKLLEVYRKNSLTAEKYLDSCGWRFDASTKQVVATKEKHKGRNFLTLCIQELSIEWRDNTKGRVTAKLRERIMEYLSPIFPTKLDAGPRGNIQRAIENFRRKTNP